MKILPSEALAMPRLVTVRHASLSDNLWDEIFIYYYYYFENFRFSLK